VLARDGPPVLQTLVSALLRTRLEIAVVGLDGSGKSTLVATIQNPSTTPPSATAPTIGLVVQRAKRRGIELLLWDLGGHQRFRHDWSTHTRGCRALVFVVDAADPSRLPEARQALQRLLEDPVVCGMPLLVLASKVDLLPPNERAMAEIRGWSEMARELHLLSDGGDSNGDTAPDGRRRHHWSMLGVSATRGTNLDQVLRWLVLQAHGVGETPAGSASQDADADADGHDADQSAWWWGRSLASAWSQRRRPRWGARRGFALLADASRSLLVEEA